MALTGFTEKDKNKALCFTTTRDIVGEEIYAKAYDFANDLSYDINSDSTSTGGTGEEQTVFVNLSNVPSGTYSIVLFTNDQVLSKDIMLVFNEDGYTIDGAANEVFTNENDINLTL
jgi:hypothetical protein